MDEFKTFDFLINEEDEVMLLIYHQEGEPDESHIDLNRAEGSAVLYRNAKDSILLEDIEENVFDSLEDADKLLVCELSRTKKEEDAEIVYAYEAEIND